MQEFIQQQMADITADIGKSPKSYLAGRVSQLIRVARFAGEKELEIKLADLYVKVVE